MRVLEELTEPEKRQLASTLGFRNVGPDELTEKIEEVLKRHIEAATEEYVRMILGQRALTTGRDIREYRLYLLIKHVFGEIPSEQDVSDLFQTTKTQSRTLIRNVLSKFQYELQEIIRATLKRVISKARQKPGQESTAEPDYYLEVRSPVVIEALNRFVASVDPAAGQITKVPGTIRTYEARKYTFDILQNYP